MKTKAFFLYFWVSTFCVSLSISVFSSTDEVETLCGEVRRKGGVVVRKDDMVLLDFRHVPINQTSVERIPGLLGGEEKVVNSIDGRKRVQNPSAFPWRAHGKLLMTFSGLPGSEFSGSGTLIGSQLVLTAAHNVWDPRYGVIDSVFFCPFKDAGLPKEKIKASIMCVCPFYKNPGGGRSTEDYDMALLKLDAFAAEYWYGIKVLSDEELVAKRINITGYPVDKEDRAMYTMEGDPVVSGTDQISYKIDTFGGNSGGAIWVQDGADQDPYCVGIHTMGTVFSNYGVRITAEKKEMISKWAKEIRDITVGQDVFCPTKQILDWERVGQVFSRGHQSIIAFSPITGLSLDIFVGLTAGIRANHLHLKHLNLDNCVLENIDSLIEVVESLSNLESLRVHGVHESDAINIDRDDIERKRTRRLARTIGTLTHLKTLHFDMAYARSNVYSGAAYGAVGGKWVTSPVGVLGAVVGGSQAVNGVPAKWGMQQGWAFGTGIGKILGSVVGTIGGGFKDAVQGVTGASEPEALEIISNLSKAPLRDLSLWNVTFDYNRKNFKDLLERSRPGIRVEFPS